MNVYYPGVPFVFELLVEDMSDQRRMLTAKEVSERLGVCRTTAYSIIRDLNQEMSRRGCKVIAGRISNEYFEEVFFGYPAEKEASDVR